GPEHPQTLHSVSNLAAVYKAVDRPHDALLLCRETLKSCEANLGRDHPETLTIVYNVAQLLRDQGKLTEAEHVLLTSYEALCCVRHPSPPTLVKTVEHIIALYEAWDKPGKTAEWRLRRDQLLQPGNRAN